MTRLFALILGLALLAAQGARAADDAPPLGRLDYAPYRVAVLLSFAPAPTLPPATCQAVRSLLTTRITQTFGAAWTLIPDGSVVENDRLAPADESGLERLSYAAAEQQLKAPRCERAYFLTLRPAEPGWVLAGREWDRTLQAIGPILTESTRDRRALADAALRLLQRLFSPLLNVDDADRESKYATLTVRAGSIPLADPQFAPLAKGAVLQPVFRFLDAKQNVRKIQAVPWTYLVVDNLAGGQARCSVKSTYRAPLAANMRRRVEAVAVRLRPDLPATRLKLVTGRNPRQALAGVFVWLLPPDADQRAEAKKAGSSGATIPLLSDREGIVTIPRDPAHPLRMIEVHSGSAVLARRPFVPGVEPEATLEVTDDRLRLSTEREIDLLRGKLIETVARRAAFIGRTRAAVKRNDIVTARQLLAELQHLPGAQQYADELNKIRQLALEDARLKRDRLSERRINDLCQNTAQLIDQYLPEDRIQTFKEEITAAVADVKPPTPALPAKSKRADEAFPLDLKAAGDNPKSPAGAPPPKAKPQIREPKGKKAKQSDGGPPGL